MNLGISNISYSGTATIKIMKGNSVVTTVTAHNKGTELLFYVLATALVGGNVANSVPKFMDIGYINNTNDTYVTRLYHTVSVNGRVVQNESIMTNNGEVTIPYGALFTAYIPNSALKSNPPNAVDALSIYNSSKSGRLAIISLNDDQKTTLNSAMSAMSGNYSIIVEWLMMVYNNEDISKLSV